MAAACIAYHDLTNVSGQIGCSTTTGSASARSHVRLAANRPSCYLITHRTLACGGTVSHTSTPHRSGSRDPSYCSLPSHAKPPSRTAGVLLEADQGMLRTTYLGHLGRTYRQVMPYAPLTMRAAQSVYTHLYSEASSKSSDGRSWKSANLLDSFDLRGLTLCSRSASIVYKRRVRSRWHAGE